MRNVWGQRHVSSALYSVLSNNNRGVPHIVMLLSHDRLASSVWIIMLEGSCEKKVYMFGFFGGYMGVWVSVCSSFCIFWSICVSLSLFAFGCLFVSVLACLWVSVRVNTSLIRIT